LTLGRVAANARLARLATVAALRSTGWLPWLLLAGWVVYAALQEPRLLRAHGIELVRDAAAIAAIAGAIAIGATLPVPRATVAFLVAAAALAAILTAAAVGSAWGTELLRGRHVVHALRLNPGHVYISAIITICYVALATRMRSGTGWLLCAGALLWVGSVLPRAETCATFPVLASIACFSSAAALAVGHCQRNA
jgi:hypothetical protein